MILYIIIINIVIFRIVKYFFMCFVLFYLVKVVIK